MNNPKSSMKKNWDVLRLLRVHCRRRPARAALPRKRRIDMVGGLFGEMTHFCFVVELECKTSRKGNES